MSNLIGGAVSGCVVFAILVCWVFANGQTFGQRCEREASAGETFAECVGRLARG